MHRVFDEILSNIDSKIAAGLKTEELQKELEKIPLDIFGRIQIDRPTKYSNIINWLPEMPSPEVQTSWTGCSNHILMTQSLAFIKVIISNYHAISHSPLSQGKVLHFGCGWGRLIRLLYKYVPAESIYGVDPWTKSIEICEQTKLHANLFVSDYLPRSLPTPKGLKFDFIMAFSVFTHLSEKATKICIETLGNYLTDTGVIALTIRPLEFWNLQLKNIQSWNNPLSKKKSHFTKKEIHMLLDNHIDTGFSFYPHNREKIEGEVTYGDTTMSLNYIKENFIGLDIVRVEYNETDPYQIIVFLSKNYNR